MVVGRDKLLDREVRKLLYGPWQWKLLAVARNSQLTIVVPSTGPDEHFGLDDLVVVHLEVLPVLHPSRSRLNRARVP